MLTDLHVENFALIGRLDLRLQPGLNVLTGETGAGKSIVVDAINALLGERVASDSIREGEDRASVQGAFDISGRQELLDQLEEQGFSSDHTLILTRDISLQGKTTCRINGRLASLGALREITQLLADVHGQHEHQLLLSDRWQLTFLDGFSGETLLTLRRQYSEVWVRLQQVTAELSRLSTDARERARMADLYRFQVAEIQQADLRDGEDAELAAEAMRLANLEKLFTAAQVAHELLAGGEAAPGAVDQLGQAVKAMQSVAPFDPQVSGKVESLTEALLAVEEVVEGVRRWCDELDVSPGRIDEVQSRLDVINGLKRKYGETIAGILTYMQAIARDLRDLETSDERRAEMESQRQDLLSQAQQMADGISQLRAHAIPRLEAGVEAELHGLGMPGARFAVSISKSEMGPVGCDRVEFLFSANPGESPRPLAKVASGGEASRTMLALKTVFRLGDPVPTLVFDEIDAGIGGRIADAVGEKLKGLSAGRQVLCVTHLAQIARFADHHLLVQKEAADGRTTVDVRALTQEERVSEVARMLGGDQESEAAVQHARELLGAGANQSG